MSLDKFTKNGFASKILAGLIVGLLVAAISAGFTINNSLQRLSTSTQINTENIQQDIKELENKMSSIQRNVDDRISELENRVRDLENEAN